MNNHLCDSGIGYEICLRGHSHTLSLQGDFTSLPFSPPAHDASMPLPLTWIHDGNAHHTFSQSTRLALWLTSSLGVKTYGGLKTNTSILPESLDFNELNCVGCMSWSYNARYVGYWKVHTKSIARVSVMVTAFSSMVWWVHWQASRFTSVALGWKEVEREGVCVGKTV